MTWKPIQIAPVSGSWVAVFGDHRLLSTNEAVEKAIAGGQARVSPVVVWALTTDEDGVNVVSGFVTREPEMRGPQPGLVDAETLPNFICYWPIADAARQKELEIMAKNAETRAKTEERLAKPKPARGGARGMGKAPRLIEDTDAELSEMLG
jgi:hypothetical protein